MIMQLEKLKTENQVLSIEVEGKDRAYKNQEAYTIKLKHLHVSSDSNAYSQIENCRGWEKQAEDLVPSQT